MNCSKIYCLVAIFFLAYINGYAQQPPINFHHLTVEDGLHDGHIQMVGQDKYGLIWFGSYGALNRYDGRVVRTYAYRAGDAQSPLSGMVFSMATDSTGNLFFGFDNGLAAFDFHNNSFREIGALRGLFIYRMVVSSQNKIFLMTEKGLIKYDPRAPEGKQATFYYDSDPLLKGMLGEAVEHNQQLYIGTPQGIVIFDMETEKSAQFPSRILDKLDIGSLIFDENNRLWVTTMGRPKILRCAPDFSNYEVYDRFLLDIDPTFSSNYYLRKDKKNRIWISTKHNGLLQYLPGSNSLAQYLHDENKTWTPSVNVHLSIFCDKDGIIWLGGNEGVNYFHPDKNLFETILPFIQTTEQKSNLWARSVVEDKNKNLWFGTPDGLVTYNPTTKQYRKWRNEPNKPPVIPSNSLRAVFCDDNNDIWVASSKGLCRYNHKTDKIEILAPGKNFPTLSYMSFALDHDGNIWFATLNGDGFYYYNTKQRTWTGISEHPVLKRFAGLQGWRFFQDSKGRHWLGFNEQGLGMHDPSSQRTYHWKSEGLNAIAGNIVIDIKEDLDGVIWIATNHGITGIDFEKNTFKTFNTDNGLSSNIANAVAVDPLNRLWIGTSKGLVMLDSSRQKTTNFGIQDGLPSLTFTEFPGYTTSNGDIIMATQKGYIRFNPLNYSTEKQKLNFYTTAYSTLNIEHALIEEDASTKTTIHLKYNENFVSFNLVALNYLNTTQTWYAYQLDGLETDWHITQDPKAVYTNVQGGNYIFRYKASLNANDWNIPEKTIDIHVDTIFYKAIWFWCIIALLLGTLLFAYLRNRKIHQYRVEKLQGKAQLLEKEKAIMQYEGLVQQLNPHFLFNSLTSLSSLIQIDSKIAKEFLENLSKTYRYILKSSDTEIVPLSDEIKFAQNFLMLQKTRFEEGLLVDFNIQESDLDKKIVPVTLQNLIENAIKHNIIDPESPLQINVFTEHFTGEEHRSMIVVQNNLQRKKYVETSNKRGLANLINLYSFMCSQPIEIIETTDSFTIKIPLI
jgi:ligand-binding sensor domain-containing protein